MSRRRERRSNSERKRQSATPHSQSDVAIVAAFQPVEAGAGSSAGVTAGAISATKGATGCVNSSGAGTGADVGIRKLSSGWLSNCGNPTGAEYAGSGVVGSGTDVTSGAVATGSSSAALLSVFATVSSSTCQGLP